ncbi:unnamed protein product [Malus baccata var. baccata]
MKRAFLEKFFLTSRVILLRKRISGIQQDEGESFPTYYERFKSLVASCPQHQMKEELLLQYFYEGLLPIERQMLDASAGGALVDKTPTAAKTLIANRALNAQQYEGWESANAIGFQDQNQPRNDPFSNTYNPGWRDHPNFKWREPQQGQQQSTFRQQPPGFYQRPFALTQPQAQPAQNKSGSSIDNDQIFQLLTSMAQSMQIKDNKVDELEKQVGQIAEFVGQFREQGKLPSSIVVNPKGGFESAKAIMLRSGKEVGTDPQPSKSAQKEDEKLTFEEENQAKATARKEAPLPQPLTSHNQSNPSNSGKKVPIPINSNVIPPNVPFPSRFLQAKNEEEEKDVLETFRKVHVNIPLLDAIKQIPKYAKCLKKLCTTRKRIREKEVVHVDHLIFPADFYVLDMENSGHSSPSPLLLGRPFMTTTQNKINVAKGAITMAFGGDMINFKISESVEKTNDVCFCCAIDVIENIGQECSIIIKRDVSRTTIKEGLGLKHEEHVPTSKSPNLAESIPCTFVQCAATSLQHMGEPSSPLSIPISNNRLLPCLVQVPRCIQSGGRVHVHLEKQSTKIRKDHYPLPFKDLKHEVVHRTGWKGSIPACLGVQ